MYYFCGPDLRFCTCDFRWNLAGWGKALTLWNFTLSSALGLQKLAIRVGLGGLLPGAQLGNGAGAALHANFWRAWRPVLLMGCPRWLRSIACTLQRAWRAPCLMIHRVRLQGRRW